MAMKNPRALLSLTMLLLAVLSPEARAAAGAFQFISGEVSVAMYGQPARAAIRGGAVNVGDVITTADNAVAQIRMDDGAVLSLRANTSMRIEAYHAGRTTGQKLLGLVYGGLRALSRTIRGGGSGELQVRTDTVVIGVRGTDHEVYHVRAEGGPPGARPGTYDRVYRGGTYMTTDGGRLDLEEMQVGYAERRDLKPVRLDAVPDFLATAPARLPPRLASRREDGALLTVEASGRPGAGQPFPAVDYGPTPLATLQSIGGVMTFSNITGGSAPVTETGAVGGAVTAFSASVDFTNLTFTGFNLTVVDAASRTWNASSTIPAPISAGGTFDKLFIPTSCAGCTYAPTNSTISVVVTGPSGGGVVAAYNLEAVGTITESVTGTVSAAR